MRQLLQRRPLPAPQAVRVLRPGLRQAELRGLRRLPQTRSKASPTRTVIAQKILSCVARAGERFGVEHIVDVLLGADTERVRRWGHDKLSTYGLLKGTDRKR